jgi:hypothetical protein
VCPRARTRSPCDGAADLLSPAALFLTLKEARKQANIFARHVAKKADDDGYRVGRCSRFQRRSGSLRGSQLGLKAAKGYDYDCYYTVVVRSNGDDDLQIAAPQPLLHAVNALRRFGLSLTSPRTSLQIAPISLGGLDGRGTRTDAEEPSVLGLRSL